MGSGRGVCRTPARGVHAGSVAGIGGKAARFKVTRLTSRTFRAGAAARAAALAVMQRERSASVMIRPGGSARLVHARETAVVRAVHHVRLGLPLDDRLVDDDL